PMPPISVVSLYISRRAVFLPPPASPTLSCQSLPTSAIYTLSLHDALPIWPIKRKLTCPRPVLTLRHLRGAYDRLAKVRTDDAARDRKSTRLNSSHGSISYAVFCLKKKKGIHGSIGCNRLADSRRACYDTET